MIDKIKFFELYNRLYYLVFNKLFPVISVSDIIKLGLNSLLLKIIRNVDIVTLPIIFIFDQRTS